MNNIKKIRKQLNISVTELAKRINMSQANLTKIENNQIELKIEMAKRISQALNISLNTILDTQTSGVVKIELINPEIIGLVQYQTIDIPSQLLEGNNSKLKAYIQEDDTMEPLLKKNSIAIINTEKKTLQNGVYLISVNNNLLIRRLQRTLQNTIYIIPENKAYQTEEINESKLQIIGKVSSLLIHNII